MIPANYPDPPKPPPANVPVTDQAWYDYAVDLQRYLVRLVTALRS